MAVPDRTALDLSDTEAKPASQADGPAPQWRRALVSAAVTTAVTVLVLVIGYERMRNDAEADAGIAGRAAPVKRAEASDRATANAARTPLPAAQLAAGRSR